MTTDRIDSLPPIEDVRQWAAQLVAQEGDAFSHWPFENGLRIENNCAMGEQPKLIRENVGTPADGGSNVARYIQLATFGDDSFARPFWDEPERAMRDVPWQPQGRFRPRQYNEIHLPHPLTQPTLVRVMEWRSYVDELGQGDLVIVTYSLYELDPEFQRQVAEANRIRAERAART